MVPEVIVVYPKEAEDESRRTVVSLGITESNEPSVVYDREHELRRNDDITAPCLFLHRHGERAGRDVLRDRDAETRHGP